MTTATAGTTPIFYPRMKQLWKCLFSTPIRLKTYPGLTCIDSAQFQKKIPKINHCGSRSSKYLELGHFTLLFCSGRQRNVQRFKTHVHSHCCAH